MARAWNNHNKLHLRYLILKEIHEPAKFYFKILFQFSKDKTYSVWNKFDPFENDQVSLARTLTLLEQEINSKNILDSNFSKNKNSDFEEFLNVCVKMFYYYYYIYLLCLTFAWLAGARQETCLSFLGISRKLF